jgi:hypothetical protein
VLTRLRPLLLLAAAGLLFFWPLLLHPTQVLCSDHSDLLTETLPGKCFLVRSWQETGEVPLWCPYCYAGNPFVHDVKVGAFYPPHLLLYLLPPKALGPALSWLVVLHVILAGWCMYAYARSQDLGEPGALVAGLGFMFAGKWLLHLLAAGHYFLVPLAWLPLVLLGLEQALLRSARGDWAAALLRAAWAGVAFGVLVLGAHPQLTFYAGVFVAVWTLGPALEQAGFLSAAGVRSWQRTLGALAAWLGLGALTVFVAVAVSAVELLPALEAAGQGSRAAGVPSDSGASTTTWLLTHVAGPSWFGPRWEDVGGFGVLWLASAALAPLLRPGRAGFQAGVGLLVFAFALGGGTALQALPGFHLFQLHPRMLLLAGIPLGLLAGTTVQVLSSGPFPDALTRSRCRVGVLAVFVSAVLLGAAAALLDYLLWYKETFHPAKEPDIGLGDVLGWLGGQALSARVYWPLVFAALLGLWWLLRKPAGHAVLTRWVAAGWVVLLLADAWLLTGPAVAVHDARDVYEPSACVRYLQDRRDERGRVLDRGLETHADTTPLDPALPLLLRIEPLRGYNSVDVLRYKEYLQFITDKSEPLRPREGPFGFPVLANFPIKNKALLDLLGTRYLLQPSAMPVEPRWRAVFTDVYPRAYQVVSGGIEELPSFTVYENTDAFPRAFVVPHAAPLPRQQILQALKAADLRQTVLLERMEAGMESGAGAEGFRPAAITDYHPNRVVVQTAEGPGGWLVLADVWFPGWCCTVDGQPTNIYRADYVFRAVRLPDGAHEVVFTFNPASYRWGKIVSAAAVCAMLAVTILVVATARTRARRVALSGAARS